MLPDESASLEGSIDSWGPEGETEATKLTVPLKPLEPASDMMELPVEPGSIAMYDGFAEIVKSGELNGPSRANSIVVGADTPFVSGFLHSERDRCRMGRGVATEERQVGDDADAGARSQLLEEGAPFVQKPFGLTALLTTVREVLDGS